MVIKHHRHHHACTTTCPQALLQFFVWHRAAYEKQWWCSIWNTSPPWGWVVFHFSFPFRKMWLLWWCFVCVACTIPESRYTQYKTNFLCAVLFLCEQSGRKDKHSTSRHGDGCLANWGRTTEAMEKTTIRCQLFRKFPPSISASGFRVSAITI